jgi:hypothetical protein
MGPWGWNGMPMDAPVFHTVSAVSIHGLANPFKSLLLMIEITMFGYPKIMVG